MQVFDAIGRSRKLPPGSLGASCARDAEADDRYYLEQWRRHGPIFKLFWGSGHLKICVVGFPLARRLLTLHRDAVRPETMDITSLVPAEYLRSMRRRSIRNTGGCSRARFRTTSLPSGTELRAILRRELASLRRSVTPEARLPDASMRLWTRWR